MSFDKPVITPPSTDATSAFQAQLFQGQGGCAGGFCADRQQSANIKKGDCTSGGTSGGSCSGGKCGQGDMQRAMQNMPGVGLIAGLGKLIGRLFG